MLIDWFTVVAQVLNFLVFVWLLKRFLYQPILDALDAREMRVAAALKDADTKSAQAEQARDEFEHKNEVFEAQRTSLLEQAAGQAMTERKRIMESAREQADAIRAKQMQALSSDVHNLNQAISRRAQQEVFAIARKALNDLATQSLEQLMVEVFIKRLQALDVQTKDELCKALGTATQPAVVRSVFDLGPAQRAALQSAVAETFLTEVELRFETAPELVSGIELTSNGQKVAWSISQYLASLEKDVEELITTQTRSKDKDGPASQERSPGSGRPQA